VIDKLVKQLTQKNPPQHVLKIFKDECQKFLATDDMS